MADDFDGAPFVWSPRAPFNRKTERLTVRLPADLAKSAREFEQAAGVRLSDQLRDALTAYLASWRAVKARGDRRGGRRGVSDTAGRPRGPARIRSSIR
jgi:predicted GNAT superfamily acetyltransferase